ncbi:MAG: F0F1 ATP synthase subunit epsilon [Candidatus Kuenenia sp.]|nr:F0F1 ATP synthase subunit epsilon [Candidatus Kuenenia hertensis]
MNNSLFPLQIVTPTKILQKEIRSIRLKDETGFFGILKGHTDFLTILVPSLCYYKDKDGNEVFLAVNGGFLHIREGNVTLISSEVFESDNAEKLSSIIEDTFAKRDKAEKAFQKSLEGLERSFMKKTVEFIRGGY